MSDEATGEAIGCSHLWKRFGDTVANRDVSLSVRRGEIHAVIGENGAGKSTLMRALYGLEPPDAGEVRLGGEVVARPSVAEAIRRRVGMVHQHFMLVSTLTVAENVVLGNEPRRGWLLDLERAAREIEALARTYQLRVEPHQLVSSLSVGEAQRVEIVKVLWRGADVLILDEPTAVLTPAEVDELFGVLRGLAKAGKTIILVTHKLDEVLALAGNITVMRRGEVVATLPARGATPADLARAMVGRDVLLSAVREDEPTPRTARVRLAIEKLTVARDDGSIALDGVDLEVRTGDILGIAGVEGNGQTELALAVAGVLPARSGSVSLDGVNVTAAPVRARQQRGLGHVPEDRQGRGLLLSMSLEDNLLLGRETAYTRAFWLDRKKLRADAEVLINRLDVRPPDPTALMSSLSGGNQQKVVVGRELQRTLSALICAQPTRGVDVGAIERIHAEILKVRASGGAVLLLSAELDEILALSDRIAVLYRGRVVGTLDNLKDRRVSTRAVVGALMLGATSDGSA